jgi:hypothetical protein
MLSSLCVCEKHVKIITTIWNSIQNSEVQRTHVDKLCALRYALHISKLVTL